MSNRLSSIGSLTYQGTNARTPPNITKHRNRPTANFYQGFALGDFWIYVPTPASNTNELWVLMGVVGNVADWVLLSGNIGTVTTLHTDDGNDVTPTLGVINIHGGNGIETTGTVGPNTVTIATAGNVATSYITSPATGTAIPSAGVLTFAGSTGLTPSASGSTVTYTLGGSVAASYPTDSGTATPSGGVLNVLGGTAARDINTSGSGNTIHVDLNNAITLGDLASITGSPALTLTTGDATITAGNINLTNTNSAGTVGIIKYSGDNFIHNYGTNNVFVGAHSGNQTMDAASGQNVGVGGHTLENLTISGDGNTAVGFNACAGGTILGQSVFVGSSSGQYLTSGSNNTFVGYSSGNGTTFNGDNNILIGHSAGGSLDTTDSNNIMIGNTGVTGDNFILRIGNPIFPLLKAWCSGIRGITTDVNDAIPVLIDSTGQLGTVSSSLRYKENVKDMGDSSDSLMKLRPVTFNYKKHPDSKEYGLIAEEVEQLFPDLVVYNAEGQVESVKYHVMVSILLNEVQKLSKRIEQLEK